MYGEKEPCCLSFYLTLDAFVPHMIIVLFVICHGVDISELIVARQAGKISKSVKLPTNGRGTRQKRNGRLVGTARTKEAGGEY